MAVSTSSLSASALTLWNKVKTTFTGLGYDPILTSGGRSAEYNSTIPGASSTSQHIGGNAFDFQIFDKGGALVDPSTIQSIIAGSGLNYGQNIAEYGLGMNGRNHLSIPTRDISMQNLVGNDGKYTPVTVSTSPLASAKAALAAANKLIQGVFGKDSPMVKGATDAVTNPGGTALEALGVNDWILRGAVAIVAILLLAAAIFSISKGSNPVAQFTKGR